MNTRLTKLVIALIGAYFTLQIFMIIEPSLIIFVSILIRVLLPFFVGLFISYLVSPSIQNLSRKIKISPGIIFLFCVIIFLIITTFIINNLLAGWISQFSELSQRLYELTAINRDLISSNLTSLGIDSSFLYAESSVNIFTQVIQSFSLSTGSISIIAVQISNIFSSVLSILEFLLFMVIAIFYTINKMDVSLKQMMVKIKLNFGRDIHYLFLKFDKIIRSYLFGMIISSMFVWIVSSIGFMIIGLPDAIVLGFICGLFHLIPLIGPYIGMVPATFVALAMSPMHLLITIIIVIIAQQLESNLIYPRLHGNNLKIHPIIIVAGIVAFGAFFGIFGMIVSTPIIAMGKEVLNYFQKKIPKIKQKYHYLQESDE